MTSSEEIELSVLGRLYRRITQLQVIAGEEQDAAFDQMAKTLRNGERRGLACAAVVIADEFARPICGLDDPFDNPIFNGELML